MVKKIFIILSVVLFMIIIFLIFSQSDKKRINKLFKEEVKSVEKKDIDGVMSGISYNYRDDYGFTYLYIKELMKREFQRMKDIEIEYENLKIKINDSRRNAEIEVDVRVIATINDERGYIIGDIRSPLHLRFHLEKERTKWLIIKTEGLENIHYME